MKFAKYTVLVALLNALLTVSAKLGDGAEAKNFQSQRGRSASGTVPKASGHGKPQWLADPERGWIRAEERHELKVGRDTTRQRGRRNSRKHGNGSN